MKTLLAEKRELDELAVILCVGILVLYLEIIMTMSLLYECFVDPVF